MRDFESPGRSFAVARHGMAATSHPASTLTAVEVLKAGGNAVDAAIAASAVQAVVEPGSTGVGGDCFAMVSLRGSADVRAYNGSGRAPAAFTRQALGAVSQIDRSSPYTVTIPGAVDAWCRLLRDFGRMSMAEVLAPAIAMARDGYALTPRVALDLGSQRDLLAADPAAAATFLVDGEAPPAGTVQRQPLLAETLDAIGREGRDGFYRGPVATDIVDRLRGLGGRHTLDDFAGAKGEYVPPIGTTYRGRTILECPPNGQGVVALLILNILSRFAAPSDPCDPDHLHRLVEATRLAYAARDAMVADPASSGQAVSLMLSPAFADRLAGLVSTDRVIDPLPAFEDCLHSDTIYLCVVDRDRNVISFINSLFNLYGSGLMAPRSGVLLHNRGQGFSLKAGHPNEIGPGKRPMHTIIPGMVVEAGRVVMPFGVMGGHYQAMGHAHLVSAILDCGLDPQEAIDLPRLFPLPGTAMVEVEQAVRDRVGAELERRGFRLQPAQRPIGGAQAILIDWQRGVLIGGSDPRKDGFALGY
jgi:gamma-glutamyltranspeptidase/glutathione hydrolase